MHLTFHSLSRSRALGILLVSLFGIACGSEGNDGTGSGGTGSGVGGTGDGMASGGGTGSGGTGSGGEGAGVGGSSSGGSGSMLVDDGSGLDSVYFDYFPLGVALQANELAADEELIAENFNRMTAGNAMKAGSIHPAEDTWNTTEADTLANFARQQGWKMTGHTMVWHRQQANWMFQDLTPGDAESIETLKARLKAHIEGMVERYGDVVDNWDVVNEVVVGDTVGAYRTEDNQWYDIFGDFEYVYWAFRYTKEALEAQAPGSSAGKLYYNDYNVNQKLTGILGLCDWLENHPEGGIRIDGIGLQGHWRIDWPGTTELEGIIESIAAAGYAAKVSELDLNVYNDYPPPDYEFVAAAEVPFTMELDEQLATRYADIFAMLRRQSANLTSVTLWGFKDEDSWLNNEPVANRANYPLLFNAEGPKAAYDAIQDF